MLTPLRLPELYVSIALAFVVAGDSVEREEAVIDDRHLLTIELAGRRAFDALLDPELGDRFGNIDKKLLSDEHKEELRRIREGEPGLFALNFVLLAIADSASISTLL